MNYHLCKDKKIISEMKFNKVTDAIGFLNELAKTYNDLGADAVANKSTPKLRVYKSKFYSIPMVVFELKETG